MAGGGDTPGDQGGRGRRDEGGGRGRQRRDEVDEVRRARRSDLDRSVYARERARQRRRRQRLERDAFDPSPPADDEWTLPDRSGLRRIPGGPQPLGDLLDQLLADRRWKERMRSAALFARWEEVVGADLARHCQPVRLVGGVLVVSASSPSWATQLQYLTATLKLQVNKALGEPLVERVEIRVDRA